MFGSRKGGFNNIKQSGENKLLLIGIMFQRVWKNSW